METNPPVYASTPPPIIVPPPPPRRSGRGWMIFSLLLLAILGLLFVSGVSGFIRGQKFTGGQSGHRFEEVTVDNSEAADKIAIIDVEGMISSMLHRGGQNMVELIQDQLKAASKDPAVKAVVLKVDSPGGEVLASDDISRALIQFQDTANKPVVAAMGGLAASGGYYVSAPCQWIVANELTITGSIGVIMHSFNYRGLMDKVGLQPQVFKSGKFKDMLSGSKRPDEVDPAEKQMIQDMIMETYGKFKQVVKDGRAAAEKKNKGKGRSLAPNWEEYADGRVITGKHAYDLGFVDQLGNFQTAVDAARRISGISGKAHLIRYQEPFDLSKMFSLFGSSESKALKIDLGVEMPKLDVGRMYYLYHPGL